MTSTRNFHRLWRGLVLQPTLRRATTSRSHLRGMVTGNEKCNLSGAMQRLSKHREQKLRFPASVFVHPSAIVEGDVVLGEDVNIWPMSVVRGDFERIEIGARSNVQDGCILHVRGHFPDRQEGNPLLIGEQVTIGHGACLHACTIESRSLIGIRAVVLDFATIREGALVAAGAVVPPGMDCGPGVWVGNPIMRLRDLKQSEQDMLLWTADNYVRLKEVWRGHLTE